MPRQEYKYRHVILEREQVERLQEIIDREPYLDMRLLVRCAIHRFLESGDTNVIRFTPPKKEAM